MRPAAGVRYPAGMRPAQPWRLEPTLRLLAALPLALAVAGMTLEMVARGLGAGGSPASRPAWLLAAGTGLVHGVALVLLVPFLRAHRLGWQSAFGFGAKGWFRTGLTAAALTVPAMVLAWLLHQASGWILDRLGIAHDAQAAVQAVRGASRPWELGLLFLFAAVTAPLVEELLFRGVLWPLARDRGWKVGGGLVVALLFALIHFNAAALLPLTVLGLFWTWLYERTGDLGAPVVSHALFNAANFAWIAFLAPAAAPPS